MSELLLHRGLGPGATPCRSCRKPIVFAVMHTSGKTAPFEVDPNGEWTIENGIAKHAGKVPAQQDAFAGPPSTRYTSHFAVCPQAAQWRKSRGES